MKHRIAYRLAHVCALALSALACERADVADGATSDDALVGGAHVQDGQLPSTLVLDRGCTAAKVGPRHILLAAHCVFESALRPGYRPGESLGVTASTIVSALTPFQRLTVKETHVNPEWVATCSVDPTCGRTSRDAARTLSDVAVIETVEEIERVPVAVVDTEPLAPGEPVIVTGAGCQSGVGQPRSPDEALLVKAGVSRLIAPSALVHPGSKVRPETVAIVAQHTLVTPGPGFGLPNGMSPGLCSGDSGGPLYRLKGRGATITGVNASYTFAGRGGLPATNWHTRLDDDTPIAAWLASLGVATCRGETCPVRSAPLDIRGAGNDLPEPQLDAMIDAEGRDGTCQAAYFDTSAMTSAVTSVLGVPAYCLTVDGSRYTSDGASYYYAGPAYCVLQGTATATPEAFEAAMASLGFGGFRLAQNTVFGVQWTRVCSSYPTRTEVCRTLLADGLTVTRDVTASLLTQASCQTSAPQLVPIDDADGTIWVSAVTCALASVPGAPAVVAFPTDIAARGRHRLDYDAATNTVRGATYSAHCSSF